ncbi:MAG TPA: glucose-1-phosphate cytidylyltransferase [Candidatus Krumholzibacteria bacterium]|nr:glucose-1-phosphate cytidylyltransferase [Candidatus Krumholzibacteria bacterium]
MKVVLFCGGLGMRIREYSEEVPKPMVPIGYRPILWHVMKYYAHFGHREFILCLGYKADVIKRYFLNYDECLSNDFTLSGAGNIELANSDIHDWKISFVDTGINTNIGGRLRAVRDYLGKDEYFLANYSDNLTDVPLPEMIKGFEGKGRVASFLCVRPSQSFHTVSLDANNVVSGISHASHGNLRINGGYFVLRRDIFDYMQPGEELVEEPFQRLIEKQLLAAYRYDGFFVCMDTFKERQALEEMYATGNAPWTMWERRRS